MDLTTILTTIWFVHPRRPSAKAIFLAKAGHLGMFFDARPISGAKSHKFSILFAATLDDLAIAGDGLRRAEKRRPGEDPTEGHAGRQGPIQGAHKAMAGRSLLGCSTASLMRWHGSRINGGG
jgi:hypothetical protein